MRQIISFELLKLAETLRLAAALTYDVLTDIIKKLIDILHDPKNFESTEGSPLQFSQAGLKQIEKLGYSSRIAKDMMSVIKMVNNAITLAGHTGNKEMAKLSKNLAKEPERLVALNIHNHNFRDASSLVKKALDYLHDQAELALEPDAPQTPVTPEELKRMQEQGVM